MNLLTAAEFLKLKQDRIDDLVKADVAFIDQKLREGLTRFELPHSALEPDVQRAVKEAFAVAGWDLKYEPIVKEVHHPYDGVSHLYVSLKPLILDSRL